MKYIFILLFLLSFNYSYAQVNLVKNPSFEQYSECPYDLDNIKKANYWSCIDTNYSSSTDSFGNPNCTPDFFHKCSYFWIMGVPYNYAGYQYPRTGNGYANVQMYDDSVSGSSGDSVSPVYQRDYLMGRLYKTLDSGQSYCVTFYVNLANDLGFAINHIGAYFDDGSIDTNSRCGIPNNQYVPQVYELDIISDTAGWTKVQGNFIANGTEKYITIGNFFSRLATDTIWRTPVAGLGHNGCYYEVDDVSVIASNTLAYAGADTSIYVGDSVYVGIDSNGEGMPCYWYTLSESTHPIDSGGRILVHPDSTTTYIVTMNLCGTITTDTVVVSVRPVGVFESGVRGAGVRVFPNPATNVVNVVGAAGCVVWVYDLVGRGVFVGFSVGDKLVIDVGGLVGGVYFVEVVDGRTGERVVRRVVVHLSEHD